MELFDREKLKMKRKRGVIPRRAWNALVETVYALAVVSVVGGRLTRSKAGTSLEVDRSISTEPPEERGFLMPVTGKRFYHSDPATPPGDDEITVWVTLGHVSTVTASGTGDYQSAHNMTGGDVLYLEVSLNYSSFEYEVSSTEYAVYSAGALPDATEEDVNGNTTMIRLPLGEVEFAAPGAAVGSKEPKLIKLNDTNKALVNSVTNLEVSSALGGISAVKGAYLISV